MRNQRFWRGSAHVEVIPGTRIDIAAQDAIDLAKQIDGSVYFEFNGVHLVAKKDSTAKELESRWNNGMEYEGKVNALSREGKQA